jgi:hypothetical protein
MSFAAVCMTLFGLIDFNFFFRCSAYPLGGSNAEKANNATSEVDDLWLTPVRSRANRCRARRPDPRAGAGLHEPKEQDLLGQLSSLYKINKLFTPSLSLMPATI